jgi:hypothetical protein
MASGPLFRTKLAWAFSRNLTENAPEGAKAVPAGPECNLGDRKFGIPKQRARTLDPPRQ